MLVRPDPMLKVVREVLSMLRVVLSVMMATAEALMAGTEAQEPAAATGQATAAETASFQGAASTEAELVTAVALEAATKPAQLSTAVTPHGGQSEDGDACQPQTLSNFPACRGGDGQLATEGARAGAALIF